MFRFYHLSRNEPLAFFGFDHLTGDEHRTTTRVEDLARNKFGAVFSVQKLSRNEHRLSVAGHDLLAENELGSALGHHRSCGDKTTTFFVRNHCVYEQNMYHAPRYQHKG